MLEVWGRRTPEEANLFNPAFLASLLHEFGKEYLKQTARGAPLTILGLSLSVVLHGPTRSRLPYSTVTSLYEWLQDNEDLLVGFARRVQGISPYYKEALRFALQKDTLILAEGHTIKPGATKGHFTADFLRNTTPETTDIIERNRFLARWFAKSGSEATIVATWGVCP